MLSDLTKALYNQGIEIIEVVDISGLDQTENRGYCRGIIIGKPLISYIEELVGTREIKKSLFNETEHYVDGVAEWVQGYLTNKGYNAFAQSECNLLKVGSYNSDTKSTPLPHKKLAVLGGLGWIGKSNLLCTKEYGSALCMCTILTDAPIEISTNDAYMKPICGDCKVCADVCPVSVITGVTWERYTHRDELVDVHQCIGCLKCMVHCPWTQKYIKNS